MTNSFQQIERRVHNSIVADVLGIRGGPVSQGLAVKTAVTSEIESALISKGRCEDFIRALVHGMANAARTADLDAKCAITAFMEAITSRANFLAIDAESLVNVSEQELVDALALSNDDARQMVDSTIPAPAGSANGKPSFQSYWQNCCRRC